MRKVSLLQNMINCKLIEFFFNNSSRSSTKEEKQRHNEEIVVMKSNSSSTEANSWETFSPTKTSMDFETTVNAASKPSCSKTTCFIDASSLFDDDEIVYPSFTETSKSLVVDMPPLCDDEKLKSMNENEDFVTKFDIRGDEEHNGEHDDEDHELNSITSQEALFTRQDERKQGNFLFQHSIQQYSGHLIHYPDDNYSDMSIPSVYSSSSEPNYEYNSGE